MRIFAEYIEKMKWFRKMEHTLGVFLRIAVVESYVVVNLMRLHLQIRYVHFRFLKILTVLFEHLLSNCFKIRIQPFNSLVKHTAIPLWPFDLWFPFGRHSLKKFKFKQIYNNWNLPKISVICFCFFITLCGVSKCSLLFNWSERTPTFFDNRVFFDFSVFHFWANTFIAVLFLLSSRINSSFSVFTRTNSEIFSYESSVIKRRKTDFMSFLSLRYVRQSGQLL